MAAPEAVRTQILALVKEYHTAKFAPSQLGTEPLLIQSIKFRLCLYRSPPHAKR